MQIRNTTILNLNINLNNKPYTRRRLHRNRNGEENSNKFHGPVHKFPQPQATPDCSVHAIKNNCAQSLKFLHEAEQYPKQLQIARIRI